WAAEKMPWMVIHMAIPLVMLAGVAVARLIEQVNRPVEGLTTDGPPLRQYGLFCLTLFLAGAALISGVARMSAAGGPLALVRIAFRTGTGKASVKVVYDSGVSWPFEWYLRDYNGKKFIGNQGVPPDAMDAPVILVGLEGNRDQAIKAQLGSKYVSQRYRLRW